MIYYRLLLTDLIALDNESSSLNIGFSNGIMRIFLREDGHPELRPGGLGKDS